MKHYNIIYLMLFIFSTVVAEEFDIQNSDNHQDDSFSSIMLTILDNAKNEAAISILYNSEKLRGLTPVNISSLKLLFLRSPPDEVYSKAYKWHKLNKNEVDALRTLLSINVSFSISKFGFTKEQIEPISHLIVHSNGIGEIIFGMTIEEASKVLALDITSTPDQYGSDSCYSYAISKSYSNSQDWMIRFITDNSKIVKIDVFSPSILLDNGIHIGNESSRVTQQYGDAVKFGNMHDPSYGSLLIKKSKIEFVVNKTFDKKTKAWIHSPNDKIIGYSISMPGVGTVEGCL
jgi:hypothetical protein